MKDLKNKIALITGGSSGIGKAVAIALAKEGCKIIILSRTKTKLLNALTEIKTYDQDASAVVCDVRNFDSVEKAVSGIISKYKTIDILINSAGIAIRRSFKNTSLDELKDTIDTNLFGTIFTTKAVLPYMIKENKGTIINIGSIAGLIALPDLSTYSASKFAVVGLSQALHLELKKYNIQVSVINPAGTDTPIFNHESWQTDTSKEKLMSPEYVAEQIILAIKKNKFNVVLPFSSRIKASTKQVFPGFYDWYLNKKNRNA